jgi:energy-coupling factor transporter transmembrane protein EcfT
MTLSKALLAQLLGLIIAICLNPFLPSHYSGWVTLLIIQSSCAMLSSKLLRQPTWWLAIHLVFLPAALALHSLQLSAHWYLLMLIVLILVFWGTVKGDVPLFLSSNAVVDAVSQLITQESAQHFAELGAGIGTISIPLAKQHPQLIIDAWEKAPIPWVINIWRSRHYANSHCYRSNLWSCDFSQYDVIFAFLSPTIMPDLGAKLQTAMRPGSLLISSSFAIPDWQPETIKQVNDLAKTQLFCYRIA